MIRSVHTGSQAFIQHRTTGDVYLYDKDGTMTKYGSGCTFHPTHQFPFEGQFHDMADWRSRTFASAGSCCHGRIYELVDNTVKPHQALESVPYTLVSWRGWLLAGAGACNGPRIYSLGDNDRWDEAKLGRQLLKEDIGDVLCLHVDSADRLIAVGSKGGIYARDNNWEKIISLWTTRESHFIASRAFDDVVYAIECLPRWRGADQLVVWRADLQTGYHGEMFDLQDTDTSSVRHGFFSDQGKAYLATRGHGHSYHTSRIHSLDMRITKIFEEDDEELDIAFLHDGELVRLLTDARFRTGRVALERWGDKDET